MRITFTIHIESLDDVNVQSINDYITSNLKSTNAFNKANMLDNYAEGCLSDPFSKMDIRFTIEDVDFDNRYALSDIIQPIHTKGLDCELDDYDWSDPKNRL